MPCRKMTNPRRALIMHRTRGLLGPGVQQGSYKVASPTSRKGVKPVGNYIIYKQLNP